MATFQEIYEKYGRKVYGFLLSLSGNETLADELLQETFFQAFQHIDKFEGRCSIYTWLCQIGKNAWLKEIRRSKRYSEISLDDIHLPDNSLLLDEQIIRKDEYMRARKAMGHGSFIDDPVAHFGAWSEYLWQEYEGCYFDPETKEYIYKR